MGILRSSHRNCLTSLGRTCEVALQTTETVLFRFILASIWRLIHARSVARITFQTVSYTEFSEVRRFFGALTCFCAMAHIHPPQSRVCCVRCVTN